jgi:acyl dehydratase
MPLSAATLAIGDSRSECVVENLTRTQLVQYAGASGDYNPLHTDEIYTTQVAGYPSVFAHGMLTMGLSGKVVTNWAGADRVKRIGVRFTNQVWPGDTLTTTATITALRSEAGQHLADLSLSTVNQHGKEVIAGTATIWLAP